MELPLYFTTTFQNPTTMFPTLDDVKRHCLVEDDSEDQILQVYLNAAIDHVQREIRREWADVITTDGDLPASLFAAILIYTGGLYDNREPDAQNARMLVPQGYSALVRPYIKLGCRINTQE